jgi:hypothetical protein
LRSIRAKNKNKNGRWKFLIKRKKKGAFKYLGSQIGTSIQQIADGPNGKTASSVSLTGLAKP